MSDSKPKRTFHPLRAQFLTSAAQFNQCPEDTGVEVAFAGRSNSGKSSAINQLCQSRSLAKTSKTPGRTQLINFFTLQNDQVRLVDLPGYGYAKVSNQQKKHWGKHLDEYLQRRISLRGLVLVMDIRHPPKPFDLQMMEWAVYQSKPILILLSKADKLSRNQQFKQVQLLKKHVNPSVQHHLIPFSSTHQVGVQETLEVLNEWLTEPEA